MAGLHSLRVALATTAKATTIRYRRHLPAVAVATAGTAISSTQQVVTKLGKSAVNSMPDWAASSGFQRAAMTVSLSPLFIALLNTPLMIANQASQTGTRADYRFAILAALFRSNCRVSFMRGTSSSSGKALTAEVEGDAALLAKELLVEEEIVLDKVLDDSLVAKGKGITTGKAAEESFLLSGTMITASVALLDSAISGLSNLAKMAALKGEPLSAVQGVRERVARVG